jgi:UDPglucose 6-dehydrogenase
VEDLMRPDRIVVGVRSERPVAAMRAIYAPFDAPLLVTDISSAELIKHASNSFLALKISYINALSMVCEATGANVQEVANGMGMDERIGRRFLQASLGFGGSCFPKDLSAFIKIAEQVGYDFRLLKEVQQINAVQMDRFVKKITDTLWVLKGKTIGVLGLAFKPNTDDVREAPALAIARRLLEEGAEVCGYDPQAAAKAKQALPALAICSDAYEVGAQAEGIVLCTEWAEFNGLDWARLKSQMIRPLILDGRNALDREKLTALGFEYLGIGR